MSDDWSWTVVVDGPKHHPHSLLRLVAVPRENSPDPDRAYAEGYKAGWSGASRSACPWAPGAEEGREWLHGWLEGRRDDLERSGVMSLDHARAEAEVRRSVQKDPKYQGDPTDILEQEEEPEPSLGAQVAHDWVKECIASWHGSSWPRHVWIAEFADMPHI